MKEAQEAQDAMVMPGREDQRNPVVAKRQQQAISATNATAQTGISKQQRAGCFSYHPPAQQLPTLQNVQAVIEAIANLGNAARVSHIGDKLLLRLADLAFGVGFDFECVKQTAAQQN
jgi:hypothetical protein